MTLPNVVTFGEVGLDYSVPKKKRDLQREFLLLLLDGLNDLLQGRPMQIHSRDGQDGKPLGTLHEVPGYSLLINSSRSITFRVPVMISGERNFPTLACPS